MIIGGGGSNVLDGGSGQDLIMSTPSLHDDDPSSLLDIHNEWTNGLGFDARIKRLTNASSRNAAGIDATMIKEDPTAKNTITGGKESDWIVLEANRDIVNDLSRRDRVSHREVQLNPTSADGHSGNPSVASSASGTTITAWHTAALEGDYKTAHTPGIKASLISSSGLPIASDFYVAQNNFGHYDQPALAIDSLGTSAVAWVESLGDNNESLQLQILSPLGVAQGAAFRVAQSNNHIGDIDIAASPTGDFVISWSSIASDEDSLNIYMQRYTLAGGLIGSPILVSESQGSQLARDPSLAIQSNGDVMVAWQGRNSSSRIDDDAFVRTFSSNLEPKSQTKQLTDSVWHEGDADVIALSDGKTWVVAWTQTDIDSRESDVYAQILNSEGSTATESFILNSIETGAQWRADLAATPDGGFVAAWDGHGQGDTQGVFGRHFSASGVASKEQFRINGHSSNDQASVSIASRIDGSIIVAWGSFNQNGPFSGYESYFTALRLREEDSKQAVNAKLIRRSFSLFEEIGNIVDGALNFLGISTPETVPNVSQPVDLDPINDSNATRFAVIGDWGYADLLEGVFGYKSPMDYAGSMVRGWNPDFIVGLGDTNYLLGLNSEFDQQTGKTIHNI